MEAGKVNKERFLIGLSIIILGLTLGFWTRGGWEQDLAAFLCGMIGASFIISGIEA